ncbi:MAG: DEAD/DEAH box helicase [Deltaproteobacteria bacterium]
MTFEQLGLAPELLQAIAALHYETPTPIQEKAIPLVLEGKDLLGCAQTGTGKTAAFALPILQRLGGAPAEEPKRGGRRRRTARPIRALVLEPARELALQVSDSFGTYGAHTALRRTVIYGGKKQGPQAEALRRGVDILVATPGRLLDLHGQGLLSLDRVEVFVLDEADRMLDMGFIRDIRRIASLLPADRQTLFFSATMPRDILRLASSILKNPVRVEAEPPSTTVEGVRQQVYYVDRARKADLLRHILSDPSVRSALVFTRTRRGADRVARTLVRGGVDAEAIHGDRSQGQREQALAGFREGRTRVLVATDVAARGLDIAELSHVVNYDVPEDPGSYVHRVGRTGRAGATGIAVSLCDIPERPLLSAIEKRIGRHLEVVADHPFPSILRPGPPTRIGPPRTAGPRPFLISVDELFGRASESRPGA